jgi:hypothetical protein
MCNLLTLNFKNMCEFIKYEMDTFLNLIPTLMYIRLLLILLKSMGILCSWNAIKNYVHLLHLEIVQGMI